MIAFLIYIFKSTVFLLVFYFVYKIFLSKETFFRINRFVLLIGIIACSILPLIQIQNNSENIIQKQINIIEYNLLNSDLELPTEPEISLLLDDSTNDRITENSHLKATEADSFSFKHKIFFIYISGGVLCFVFLLIAFHKTARIIRNGKIVENGKYKVIVSNKNTCSFSIGKYIVLQEKDYFQNPEEILLHEKIHIRKKHTLDILLMEVFILLHWFNPAAWLLKKEMQDIHEYEADLGVIQSGIDATKYQLLLVKKAVGARSYAIANNFNHGKIKKRITMMLQKKSTKWSRMKLLLIIPAAVLTMYAFAQPKAQAIEEELNLPENDESASSLQSYTKTTEKIEERNHPEGEKQELYDNATAIVKHYASNVSKRDSVEAQQVKMTKITKKTEDGKPERIEIMEFKTLDSENSDAYYIVDGKRYSPEQYKEIEEGYKGLEKRATLIGFMKEYLPFAKGKILEVRSGSEKGLTSPPWYMESPASNTSHVQFLINEKEYSFDDFKSKYHKSEGKKYTNKKDIPENSKTIDTFQIISKENNKTATWYIAL